MKRAFVLFLCLTFFPLCSAALTGAEKEKRDKASYVASQPDPVFMKMIQEWKKKRGESGKVGEPGTEPSEMPTPGARKSFRMEMKDVVKPTSLESFKQVWHFPPVTQDLTSTCWSFSTTSFLESEVARLNGQHIKLSEMHTVYYEFLEKVREFIRTKGKAYFGEGSQSEAVLREWKKYGAVPLSVYPGLPEGETFHNHSLLFQELNDFLAFLKEKNFWDEERAVVYAKFVLDKYLGVPPQKFTFNGKEYTPLTFVSDLLKINPDDYVAFMSTLSVPYYTKDEYKVPDNWWHSKEYHNVPLEAFYGIIKRSIQRGYSIAIGGDTSEPGIVGDEDIAVVPTFDIPGPFIDQYSREMRFSNRTSTDDHGIHIVGYTSLNGTEWFLIKDSGRGGHRGLFKGYIFYRADYIKLKMLTIMVHKDMASDLLKKFPKP